MSNLNPVDRVEVQILVDNLTDGLSTTPAFVEDEMSFQWRRGMKELSGSCLCCAAHGLSCLITAHRGDARRTLLFDTGPDIDVFQRNVALLGAGLTAVDAMVLSHGHWDHAGAMPLALDLIRQNDRSKRIPVYMHPDMFASRAMRAADGTMRLFADIPGVELLESHGAEVRMSREPGAILDGMFELSGEIPRITPFEIGMPGQYRKEADGSWSPDPLLIDERFVTVHVAGRGLVIFSACSHAGIINVVSCAREQHPGTPILCVLGGFHLSGANEKIIPETVEALRGFNIETIASGHCTGWRATAALANAFGESVLTPLAVGKRYTFAATAA